MNQSSSSHTSYIKLALVLGLLTAVGPFAVDMYLPALPSLETSFHTTTDTVQQTLTVFFIAMGFSQLIYGPLSDLYGRKVPLYGALLLFTVATVACSLATSIETLLFWRFLQGLGASAGSVIGRAVVRDYYTGTQAAKLMSLLMLIFSISPILAPLVGSLVLAFTANNWRAIFWVITLASIMGMGLAFFGFPEKHHDDDEKPLNLLQVFRSYFTLLKDPIFLGLALIGSFGMASFFCFLSSSSFVLTGYFKLTPTHYSMVFGLNAAVFFLSAQLNGPLTARFGLGSMVAFGVRYAYLLLVTMLLYFVWFGGTSLYVFVTLLCLSSIGMAWTIPTSTVMAMDRHGKIAGAASALVGTLQMIIGGIASGVMAHFNNGTVIPMVTGMVICSSVSFVLSFLVLRPRKRLV